MKNGKSDGWTEQLGRPIKALGRTGARNLQGKLVDLHQDRMPHRFFLEHCKSSIIDIDDRVRHRVSRQVGLGLGVRSYIPRVLGIVHRSVGRDTSRARQT